MRLRCQQLVLLTAMLTMTAVIAAHPGSGLVVADDGTMYFVYGPGHRLWKVSPDGESSLCKAGSISSSACRIILF